MPDTSAVPPRSLAEIDEERRLVQAHRDSFNRVVNENLPPDEERLEVERLARINEDRAAIVAKRTPPALEELPLPPAIAEMDPRAAAKRMHELMADPSYFADAVPLAKRAAREALVAEVQALNRRAASLPKDIADMTPAAAKEAAYKLRRNLSTGVFLRGDALAEAQRDIEWLNARAAEGGV